MKLKMLAVIFLLCSSSLAQQEINGYRTLDNVAAPATPAAGKTKLYVDSTLKKLCTKDDAGIVNCLALPPGTIVSSTNITFPGAVAATSTLQGIAVAVYAYLDATSSIQTQLNSKPTAALDTDGTMAANSDARVPSQKAVVTYVGAHGGLPAGPTSPNGVPQTLTSTPSGGVAGTPAYALPGFKGRAVTGTTSTDTILVTDDVLPVVYQGSVAVATALPTATTLGITGFATELVNNTSGSSTAVTVTPATWTINGSSTLVIAQGQACKVFVDPSGTNWDAVCHDLQPAAGSGITITRGQYGPTISATGTQTIASGSLALAVSSIGSGACQTVTAGSVNSAAATGVATTDAITFTPNGSIKAVTGYVPATTGGLTIAAYPTSGYVNFDVCNWTSGAIVPGAVTLNWRVTR
jgi:hypothetical protein